MSNALKKGKKKNRMEPLGYTKNELIQMQRCAREKQKTDGLIREAYYNVRLIAYQLLHDDFGYGNKRIVRVEQTIESYLESAENGELTQAELQHILKSKWSIDVAGETDKIPFRQLFALTGEEKFSQHTGMCILATICNYFSLLGVCLKTQMKMSANNILRLYERIRYYIDSIAAGYETMTGIASVLYQECKYCDVRFIGKFYRV